MIEIGRKDDSWQKPACTQSVHRRGIFYLLERGLELRNPLLNVKNAGTGLFRPLVA